MDEENKNTTPTPEEVVKTTEPEVKEAPKVETKKAEEKTEPKVKTSTTQQPKKKKKVGLIVSIIIIILAVIGGAIGGAVYATLFAKTEVDLSKYISIEFEGYEGYASFDEDDLVIDEKGLKKVLEDKSVVKKLSEKLLDKVSLKNNENLKNGDEIEVKFKVSENWLKENKIKLASDTVKIKVKDLEEPNTIDLFKDLEFNYSGVSPDLTVSLKNSSEDNFIKNKVSFSMETEKSTYSSATLYNVANGDKIKVSATYSQDDLESAGYIVKNDEYEFTVKDQAEYITTSDAFTSTIKETVQSKLLSKVKSNVSGEKYNVAKAYHEDFSDVGNYNYNFTNEEPVLEKMYIATYKDLKNIGYGDYKNIVYGIYKVTFTDSTTSKTYDYYMAAQVENLVADANGLSSEKTYYYSEFNNYYFTGTDGNDYHRSADEMLNAIKDKVSEDDYTFTEVK